MKKGSLENGSSHEAQDANVTSRIRKVRCACIVFNVPGDERDLTIPAFTAPQMLGVLKIVENVGNDFHLAYELAGFVFEKLVNYHSVEPGSIPSDNLYADWLREFRARKGMLTGPFAAIGNA